MSEILIFALLAINVLQFIYWAWLLGRLENKLMSRDFHNYVDSQRPEKPKNSFKLPLDEIDLNSEIQPF